eukprot:157933_1
MDITDDNLENAATRLVTKCIHIVVLILTLPVTATIIAFSIAVVRTFEFDIQTDIATWRQRPHRIPYFLGNNHFHEFGDVYGYTVVVHVFCGLMANIMVFAILRTLFTNNKSVYHYIFGYGVLVFSILFYIAGQSCGVVLIVIRTFHPCAYYIQHQTVDTSFPFLLYLQYVYYGPWLVEMLSYGMIYVSYRPQNMNKLPKYVRYICCYFSVTAIFSNISRIILLFSLIPKRKQYMHENCGSGHSAVYDETTAIIIGTLAIVFEWPTSIFSIMNFKFMIQREKSENVYWMRKMHGKCFYIASGIIVWTLFANIFWKLKRYNPLWNIGTFVSYFLTAALLSFFTIDSLNKCIKSRIYQPEKLKIQKKKNINYDIIHEIEIAGALKNKQNATTFFTRAPNSEPEDTIEQKKKVAENDKNVANN